MFHFSFRASKAPDEPMAEVASPSPLPDPAMGRRQAHDRSLLAALDRSTAVIEFDLDGNVLTANGKFLETLGYGLDDIVGQHHRMFLFPEDVASPEYQHFWEELRAGNIRAGLFRRRAADGAPVYLEASYNPLLDENGALVGFVKFATDVTAPVTEARDHKGQITALTRSQAVVEFAPDGTILRANDKFCDLLGYSCDEIVGVPHSALVDEDQRMSAEYADFWTHLRAGEFWSGEFRRRARDGREVWIEATYNPVFDSRGEVRKVVKFASDTTGRRAAMNRFSTAVRAMRAGDMTQILRGAMEGDLEGLRRDFNSALASIADLVGMLVGSVSDIQGQSTALSNAADELGRRTKNQAVSLRQTTVAVGALSSRIDTSRDGAQKAEGMVRQARTRSDEGRQVVEDTIGAMNDIAESSARISTFTNIIEELAFQTNLLALNAGVEAAKAGSAGGGFAVIATEVRALARRSAEAATEIGGVLASSSKQVEHGVNLVNHAGEVLSDINDLVGQVDVLVTEIAKAATEQSHGVGEINQLIHQLDQVTRANSAMFAENTASVAALRALADTMAGRAAVFRISS